MPDIYKPLFRTMNGSSRSSRSHRNVQEDSTLCRSLGSSCQSPDRKPDTDFTGKL
ncbi:hypothetical protein WG66_008168 [Moniliophthora roreri]|nr:hypothetical protein WG66_008168 [Moniliophthora roreri]